MTASRARIRSVPVRPVQERYLKPLDADRGFKTDKYPQSPRLQKLQLIQHMGIGVTLTLAASMFGLYSWHVESQKQWNQQYRQLEALKQMEGKLINAAEALDHERVQGAWAGNYALTRETPATTLFLEEMPLRPPVAVPKAKQLTAPPLPIAY